MKQYEAIKQGVTYAAFGCLVLHLHFNINTIDLLPNFLAYILFLLAINNLKGENRDFNLLVPLGTLLVGWNLAHWLLNLFGISIEGELPILGAFITAVDLYFCFQFFTDLALLAERMQREDQNLSGSICGCRNILTVTTTMMALPLGLLLKEEQILWILTPVLVIGLGAALVLTVKLFSLKKLAEAMADQ